MKSSMSLHRRSPPASDLRVCCHCGHAGCDVRIKGCGSGCSYHARCIDLAAIVGRRQAPPPAPPAAASLIAPTQEATIQQQRQQQTEPLIHVARCPSCSLPASGLEIVPLSFAEIDEAQLSSGGEGPSGGDFVAQPGKRMHASLLAGSSSSATSRGPRCSFSSWRTGKWTDEEVAFREEIVMHFMEGNLPLPEGLKLIEFLGSMLKSKPSRLTKKMKRAKLSTRHFNVDSGFIRSAERARALSMLELAFVNSVPHPVERSEVRFHMQHEWRGHLAERLTHLRVAFDADEWLGSVDAMERRVAFAKSLRREVKRRHMTGVRSTEGGPGEDARPQEDFDLELLASALESNESADDAELVSGLYSGLAAGGASAAAAAATSIDSGKSQVDDIRRSPGIPMSRSPSLSSQSPAEGPNFRFAAPFLAKITAYIEKNRVPFEHVDSWVPSSADDVNCNCDTAPEPIVLGSGSVDAGGEVRRLCFAGSATASVQIAPDGPDRASLGQAGHRGGGPEPESLSPDDIYQLSLFGSYSEKFSFLSGCGLPGRVHETGVPAWEQFIADAPPDMFERRGGAMQFGIKTALGLPIESPNVGRIVLVLYSRHNRERDAGLVARMVSDFQGLHPSPRWKLMVDIGNTPGTISTSMAGEREATVAVGERRTSAATALLSERNVQVSNLIALLGENMPSDRSTQLGQQMNNIMSLRLILLRHGRIPQDEQLLDSILTLFQSYVQAGRSRSDIAFLLARDFAFHSAQLMEQRSVQQHSAHQQSMHQHSMEQHSIRQSQQQVSQQLPSMPLKRPPLQRQLSIPAMQRLPQGEVILEHQWQTPRQLDHTHHGQQQPPPPLPQDNSSLNMGRGKSSRPIQAASDNTRCRKSAAVAGSRQLTTKMTIEGRQSTPVTSLTGRNSPNPNQPRATPPQASQILDPPKGDVDANFHAPGSDRS